MEHNSSTPSSPGGDEPRADDWPTLGRLADRYGIQPGYHDIWGNYHATSAATQQALLAAMGVTLTSEHDCGQALADIETADWRRMLAPVYVVSAREPTIDFVLPATVDVATAPPSWQLDTEDGTRHDATLTVEALAELERRELDGRWLCRYRWRLAPAILDTLGYHRLRLTLAEHGTEADSEALLIVTPEHCFRPADLSTDDSEPPRWWGLSLQLYALRSRRNWGIGDFTDLSNAVAAGAELGAAAVGLNPLHALFPDRPEQASPYSPSSRLFLNPLYIDIEATADFADCAPLQAEVSRDDFQARLRSLRAAEMVDYNAVAALKWPLFERLYQHFRERCLDNAAPAAGDRERAAAFRAFQQTGGEPLRRFALHEALQQHLSDDDDAIWGWPVWPQEYRQPDSAAVAAFADSAAGRERVEFYQYLQWQAELQLAVAARLARRLGLPVGLYRDLAVGVDSGGAEAWSDQTLYAPGVRIGAPPDEFSPRGQDWGLPPFKPRQLTESRYAPYIATLRANMRASGALRVDHVLGLLRLYWVPASAPDPRGGAYVSYPLSALLGILALESQRHRCIVIGEDLGTVPDELRAALAERGVLSYRLLYFEKDWHGDGGFLPPDRFPEQALVAATTHDLPTLAGFWAGRDLELRRDLELFPSQELYQQQTIARAEDRTRLLLALEAAELLPNDVAATDPPSALTPALTRAVHAFIARTPSALMLAQIEDALGQTEQVNLPGTVDQHPNWRRKLSLDLEDWTQDNELQALAAALAHERGVAAPGQTSRLLPSGPRPLPAAFRVPRATYRLQFNSTFRFADACELIPYLAELGISDCYASPFLKARPGSSHGYDIVDHGTLNPEIGGVQDFERLQRTLRRYGMGLILDIVPNHMGVMGADNEHWLTLLEHGPAADDGPFFDVDWQPPNAALQDKVLVPVLGQPYGDALDAGELVLGFDPDRGEFAVSYHEHRLPLDPCTYPLVLQPQIDGASEGGQAFEISALLQAFAALPAATPALSAEQKQQRARDAAALKRELARLYRRSADTRQLIKDAVVAYGGRGDDSGPKPPQAADRLHALLEQQRYRVAYWRVAAEDINYRRFFDVNDLAGLRVEDRRVFDAAHALVLDMLANGELSGLRIDHPDGLYDPAQYFRRLQAAFSDSGEAPLYVVVEKILEGYESLPAWPVAGTTGYEFANEVNGLFVDPDGEALLTQALTEFSGHEVDFDQLVYHCKRLIMQTALVSELNVLANRLSRLAESDRRTRDFTLYSLRLALVEVVAYFPVYRSYITPGTIGEDDAQHIDRAVARAKAGRLADSKALDFLREVLLTQIAEGRPDDYRQQVLDFVMRFQQYTGPVMAKGLEDTAFYRYPRLLSLNEVGGDPRRFGVSLTAFHYANKARAEQWPHTLLSTSTHDSKRGEDQRARLNALSELGDEWRAWIERWRRLNQLHKAELTDGAAPSPSDELLYYQTLIGAWPTATPDMQDNEREQFRERVKAYMIKAVREAKSHSSWLEPNADYETALERFIDATLTAPEHSRFIADLLPAIERIATLGYYNGLSQTLLKLTAPGVPDIYQGCELWNLSLVDPDNRRPVDYQNRRAMLAELRQQVEQSGVERTALLADLLANLADGRAKLYTTWQVLALRQRYSELFRDGDYLPLELSGAKADHVCAYARQHQDRTVIVIAPRWFNGLLGKQYASAAPVGDTVWQDTALQLPAAVNTTYRDCLSGRRHDGTQQTLPLAAVLHAFPLALLMSE